MWPLDSFMPATKADRDEIEDARKKGKVLDASYYSSGRKREALNQLVKRDNANAAGTSGAFGAAEDEAARRKKLAGIR